MQKYSKFTFRFVFEAAGVLLYGLVHIPLIFLYLFATSLLPFERSPYPIYIAYWVSIVLAKNKAYCSVSYEEVDSSDVKN